MPELSRTGATRDVVGSYLMKSVLKDGELVMLEDEAFR
jgi:hypothetical protein